MGKLNVLDQTMLVSVIECFYSTYPSGLTKPTCSRSLPSVVEDTLLRPLLIIQQLLPEFIPVFKSSLTDAADSCPI